MAVTFAGEAGSQEMFSFLDELDAWCVGNLKGEYHLVGDGPMAWEMSKGFHDELTLITLLTAGAIYLVVALTFRNLLIPALLVLIVQCGVYLTVLATGLQGYSIYYLALLIVQCILMGATVDYGILFTSNYRDARARMGVAPALESAYVRSIHTVMTSGLIIVLVCGAIAMFGAIPPSGRSARPSPWARRAPSHSSSCPCPASLPRSIAGLRARDVCARTPRLSRGRTQTARSRCKFVHLAKMH